MENTNEMELIFDSSPVNEGLARVTVAAFCTQLNPTLEEVADLKTAVSEAVTNCIIHAYEGKVCKIRLTCRLAEKALWVDVEDQGVGISDIRQAMEPLFTTCETGERAGLGFSIMGSFMDRLRVRSKPGSGTSVTLEKIIVSKGK